MKNLMIGLLMAGGLILLGACGGDKAPEGGAAAGDAIGVTECDDYLKKYEACTAKTPAPGKAAMEATLKSQREAFKKTAATPEGKTALKTSCKASLDALAQNPVCK